MAPGTPSKRQFKTIIIHTAHDGVQRDYMYELLNGIDIANLVSYLEKIGVESCSSISLETTEGASVFRSQHVTGIDLEGD